MRIDAVYVPFRVSPGLLGEAVKGMRAFGIGGLNVTVPHKTAVIEYLDSITDEAKAVGAVNTITNNDSRLIGDNTDVYGFIMSVLNDGGIERLPSKVCVLGAGGAARGVVYACASREEVSEVTVINRTVSKADAIAADLSPVTHAKITALPSTGEILKREIPSAGLVVNTTSLGMFPNTAGSPVPDADVFRSGQIVCDIVYNPMKTRFLQQAEEEGAVIVGGLPMLAYQGARSLSLWTGMEAPVKVMLEVLKGAMTVS